MLETIRDDDAKAFVVAFIAGSKDVVDVERWTQANGVRINGRGNLKGSPSHDLYYLSDRDLGRFVGDGSIKKVGEATYVSGQIGEKYKGMKVDVYLISQAAIDSVGKKSKRGKKVHEQTHHADDGKFTTPKSAKSVSRGGERFMVVRQHRRMFPPRHDPGQWIRYGDYIYRKTPFALDGTGPVPFGGDRYARVSPRDVRKVIRDFALLLSYDETALLQGMDVNSRTPFVVHLKRRASEGVCPCAWGNALNTLISAGYTLVQDAFGERPVYGGSQVYDAAMDSGEIFLMKRG